MNFRNPLTHIEINSSMTSAKLNWLRAAVLGANDGIVSVSSVIVGVAGATDSTSAIITAGVAAIDAFHNPTQRFSKQVDYLPYV